MVITFPPVPNAGSRSPAAAWAGIASIPTSSRAMATLLREALSSDPANGREVLIAISSLWWPSPPCGGHLLLVVAICLLGDFSLTSIFLLGLRAGGFGQWPAMLGSLQRECQGQTHNLHGLQTPAGGGCRVASGSVPRARSRLLRRTSLGVAGSGPDDPFRGGFASCQLICCRCESR